MSQTYDVAVIGAGTAGIVAARDLSAKLESVVLLEARDRIGGRTYTDEVFDGDISVDLGGGYVHWTQPHVWHEIEKHGLQIKPPLLCEKYLWLADGKVHSGTEPEFNAIAGPILSRFFADARARFPLPFQLDAVENGDIEQQSIGDRIEEMQLSPYERDVLDGALSGICSSYTDQGLAQLLHAAAIYFGDFNAFFETAGFWSIEGGTRRLLESIMRESRAEVRLSVSIRSISDDGSKVTITSTDGETITASSVVVAVPLNNLAGISTSPDLPLAARQMVEQKNPIKGVKIWIRVKGHIEPFNGFAPIGKGPINAFRTECHYKDDTLIMGICSNSSSIELENRVGIQEALRRFVPEIEVVDIVCHNWSEDPFSAGGWMMHRPGNLTGAAPLMRQPHGRIHFAGSDFAALEVGSIEGAMQSGVHAARNVLKTLANGQY